jgi:hypothetical protein
MTVDNLVVPVRAKVILRQHLAKGLALMSTTVGCLEDSLLGSLGSSTHHATTAATTAGAATAGAATAGAAATAAATAGAGAASAAHAALAPQSLSAAVNKPATASAAEAAIDSTAPAVAEPAGTTADITADSDSDSNSESSEVIIADSDSSSSDDDDADAAEQYDDSNEFYSSASRERQRSLHAAAVAAAAAQETSAVEARVVRAASHLSVFSGNSHTNSNSSNSSSSNSNNSTDRASADNFNSACDSPRTPRGQEGHGVVQRIRAAGVSEGEDLPDGGTKTGADNSNLGDRRRDRSRSGSVLQRAGSSGGGLVGSGSGSKRAVVLPIMHLHKLKGIASALSEQNKVSVSLVLRCNYAVTTLLQCGTV